MGDFVNVSINEVKQAAVAIARESFYAYCQLRLPKIYRPERKHLKKLCDILQRFAEDKLLNEDGLGIKNVIINMPPRHGKTLTVELLCEWMLGKKPETAIMAACYNEELSGRFGKAVRNGISERSPDPTKLCYDDFFPGVKVKQGDASFFLWALEGRHFSFLASSPGGTMTGFGTNCLTGDTVLNTSIGDVDMDSLSLLSCKPEVLSFNHETGKCEYKKIEKFISLESVDNYELKTVSGKTLTLTADHPVWINNLDRYVTAKELEVLYGDAVGDDRLDLLLLRSRFQKKEIRDKKELCGSLLLFQTQLLASCDKKLKKMSKLRKLNIKQSKVLLNGLQERSFFEEKKPEIEIKRRNFKKRMFNLWKRVSSKDKILQSRVCGCEPFEKHDLEEKLKFQRQRSEKCSVLQNGSIDSRKRRQSVCLLWKKDWVMCPSYRSRQDERCSRKHDNDVSELSCCSSQVKTDSLSSIKRLGDKKLRVYDIQVESNHNFFANKILTHNCLIIDDIIKNSQESMNDRTMENHWDWYNNTVRSRVEAGGKQIVIQTRWSTKDLSGRLLDSEPGKWHLISMPAYDEATGLMLCEDMFSRDDFEERERILDPVVFKGNYQQQPYDSVDRLYTFQTYTRTEIPNDGVVQCYIDTADGGGDYLAAVFFRAVGMKLFIVDIVFTAESMEKSEPLTAETAIRHGCTRMYIESNSGGGGFGRAVQRIMAESGYTGCQFEMFHQMENKVSRILSNATSVSNSILMPDDWAYRWPAAYRELTSMGRSGKWLHEDLGDAITGALEKGLGAGLNPKVYPDYSRNLISRITVEPGETILFAQSLNGAYPHGVACVRRNNEIHVIKTFLDESLEAVAQGIRDAFIGHDIYWYPYSDGVELSASTIKLMQSHGIKTRIGNIFPSDLEMISVPNNLMRRGRLLFVENCQSVTSALEVRRFDDRGKPETLRGSRPIYLTCDCISYLIWRMIGQYPQIGA